MNSYGSLPISLSVLCQKLSSISSILVRENSDYLVRNKTMEESLEIRVQPARASISRDLLGIQVNHCLLVLFLLRETGFGANMGNLEMSLKGDQGGLGTSAKHEPGLMGTTKIGRRINKKALLLPLPIFPCAPAYFNY